MLTLENWSPRPRPSKDVMRGRHVTLRRYQADRDGADLWNALGGTKTNQLLYHFGWPEMQTSADLSAIIEDYNQTGSFVTYVFCDPDTEVALGMASYMRIDEKNGVIEVGAVAHGQAIARKRAATEAHFLMASHIFDDLHYRRYEWKLNNTNQPSHAAARRFGFTFEGVFRQAEVKPYGNRDTAWYSMLDKEWPQIKRAFEGWLDDRNFDAGNAQIQSLSDIRGKLALND